ncbi:putative penicillin-binding protein [Pseudomassariella vexata]|uniref:Putative penicillin-binding protein n=1 Tax=Pseudomassariella vexata TaxID=1141098 RepID=A0A1Y2DVH0_9PEZI|nr:putative penicillin-binding protein [Pseudomassariella vexata]ORY62645.1 putative penicillin-binding protein [Pseudomassariella vexata]
MRLPPICSLGLGVPAVLATQKVLGVGGKGNPLDDDFNKFAIDALGEFHVTGIAIAVVDGMESWAAGYGNATLPSSQNGDPIPVTPSTLFYCGSTTKAFTAATLSLMIDSGIYPSLSWQTPISTLIRDDFVLMDPYTWEQNHLTLEDALSHRTGFPRHDKSLGTFYGPDHHKATVRDLTRSLRWLPMVSEPRTKWRYCNLMFMVVSHAMQTLTGQWLGTTFRERIWAPLGMNSTYLSLEDALAGPEHLAGGYYWDYDAEVFETVSFSGLDEASGAGGVVSNVLDYTKWIRCLLNEATPLSKAGHEAIKTPRMAMSGNGKGYDSPMLYALAWQTSTYKGHRVYTHSGGMEAYGAEVYFLPDLGYGVVTLGNTALTSNYVGNILVWKLINDKLGIPESDRFDWAATAKQQLEDIVSSIDNAVERLYPDRADPPLPHLLALEAYTGTYFHPAYQNLTINLANGSETDIHRHNTKPRLRAVREDVVWQNTFDFEHVSGEFWVVFINMLKVPNGLNEEAAKAEFRVGATGRPEQLMIEFMEEGSEGVIEFEKIN